MADSGSMTGARRTSDELAEFLRSCMHEPGGDELARHVDLDLGDIVDTGRERALYQLLGVQPSTQLLLGVSWVSGDINRCRRAYGEPRYRLELTPGDQTALAWDVWKAPASALEDGPLAAASLVLPANGPQWVLFTEPAENNPMLFATPGPCSVQRGE